MGVWEFLSIIPIRAYLNKFLRVYILSTILPYSQKVKKIKDNGSLPFWFVWEGLGINGRIE